MFGRRGPVDYDEARFDMVETQVMSRGIRDESVIRAMREVPRHLFVPESRRDQAYHDRPLPIGQSQTISQPYIVAYMTAALQLGGQEKVLEIGTGSGYQTAVLSRLAKTVISIERIEPLATAAMERLASLGYGNVRCVIGDGSQGYPDEAPYDAIMMTAAAPQVPVPLQEQLADGGRLVGPVGGRYDQLLVRVWRRGSQWDRETLVPVIFVPLVGTHGWQEER